MRKATIKILSGRAAQARAYWRAGARKMKHGNGGGRRVHGNEKQSTNERLAGAFRGLLSGNR
jgi:hypothetical protein